jgi:hypothetical protein
MMLEYSPDRFAARIPARWLRHSHRLKAFRLRVQRFRTVQVARSFEFLTPHAASMVNDAVDAFDHHLAFGILSKQHWHSCQSSDLEMKLAAFSVGSITSTS